MIEFDSIQPSYSRTDWWNFDFVSKCAVSLFFLFVVLSFFSVLIVRRGHTHTQSCGGRLVRVVAVCLTIVVYEFGHNTIRLSSRSLAALTLFWPVYVSLCKMCAPSRPLLSFFWVTPCFSSAFFLCRNRYVSIDIVFSFFAHSLSVLSSLSEINSTRRLPNWPSSELQRFFSFNFFRLFFVYRICFVVMRE